MSFKVIIPKKPNLEDFKLLVEAVEETRDEADEQFARTYRTFDHPPEFKKEIKQSKDSIVGSTTTTEKGSSANPYPFLARGTSVRYATMTPGFVAKTTPGLLSSRKGKGGMLYVNKNRPRPGIEKRNWEERVREIQEKRFKTRVNKALGRYAKKSGHAI